MKTYSLTPEQFSALRTKLLEMGVTLPAENSGTLAHSGITLKYNYRPPDSMHVTGSLTLSVQQKPFLIPESMIWNQVDTWIQSACL